MNNSLNSQCIPLRGQEGYWQLSVTHLYYKGDLLRGDSFEEEVSELVVQRPIGGRLDADYYTLYFYFETEEAAIAAQSKLNTELGGLKAELSEFKGFESKIHKFVGGENERLIQ